MLRSALPPLALAALLAASSAGAQTAAPAYDPSEVRRLSPEEKERILANSDERTADAALNSVLGGGIRDEAAPAGQVHGEVGFVVGTGGTLGAFGTARIPLGDRGAAIISLEDFRSGNIRRPR